MPKAYLYNLSDTWDAVGTTFTAIKMSVTDTASAAGSLLMDLQVGGSSKFKVDKNGLLTIAAASTAGFDVAGTVRVTGSTGSVRLYNDGSLSWSSTGFPSGSADIELRRDAADTLAQRRSTNAQAFRIYNTFTDASNYERLEIGAGLAGLGTNTFGIIPRGAGSGSTIRPLYIGTVGAGLFGIVTSGTTRWTVTSAGDILAGADNTYDIGASGANRPRNLYVAGRSVIDTLTIGLGGQTSVASNTALGFEALLSASLTGINNVGVGYRALRGDTTGANNTAVGAAALQTNTTGGSNTAVGVSALLSNTTGGSSAAFGYEAGRANTSGANNSFLGAFAGYNNTNQANNAYVGYAAGYYFDTSNNVALGYQALLGSSTVANNTASNTTAVGYQALYSLTSGADNTALGYAALRNTTTGGTNSAAGFTALYSNTTGGSNTAAGHGALYSNTTSSSNSAFGRNALYYFNTANNTAVGFDALRGSTTVANNTGNSNVAVGYKALNLQTSGGGNVGLGTLALEVAAGGSYNNAIGYAALRAVSNGANNIGIGFQAGDAITTGSTNIVIGHDIDVDSATGSNQINIGDRYFHDRIRLLERTSDPAKPAEGNMIVWMSDGTGLGDDGDVIIASTAGGVTNYAILFDHSAGTLWP